MAQYLTIPSPLAQPFANNGDKNTIPETNDPSDGLMSQSLGFPPITSTLVSQGGLPPRRADFNGAFNMLSQQHYFLQNGGKETFRQEVSDAIGGYPVNALLWYDDPERGMRFVRSLIQNNTYNFNTNPEYIDGSKWEDTITTIGQVQALLEFIYPVGSMYLTTNANCPLSNIFGTWQLVNSGKALWTGNGTNGGSTIEQELPQHTHENVHYHQRGTMEITANGIGVNGRGGPAPSGAVYVNGTGAESYDGDAYTVNNLGFSASRSWTGGTSAPSSAQNNYLAKNSTGSVDNNSVYKTNGIVQPPAYVINAFRRIA